jgi:hypothetical protein
MALREVQLQQPWQATHHCVGNVDLRQGRYAGRRYAPVHTLIVSGGFMTRRYQNAVTILRRCFPRMLPFALLLSYDDGWLPPLKVGAINRGGNMTSAPSWNQQDWTTRPSDNQRDDLVRDLESILSRSAPPPSNQQDWTTRPKSDNQNNGRRSIGRRVSRAFARYLIIFLFGIGLTLAWQSHGDEAMEMVRTEVPSLAWLLPVSTAKPSPDSQASAAAPVTSDELVEQLKPLAFELANVDRTVKELGVKVEQLGIKVNQMSQSIVLQSVEQKPQSRISPPRPPHPPGQ